MKRWLEILLLSFLVLVILINGAYLFVLLKGSSIITRQLEDLTGRSVSLDYFNVTLPLNIEIYNLNIEGLGKVDRVFISPNIFYLLTGKITVNKLTLIRPRINYERAGALEQAKPLLGPKKKWASSLILRNLTVQDARIDFVDRRVSPDGIMLIAKDISFSLNNVYLFPFSVITNFELEGSIPWQEGEEEGKIEAQGWFNFYKKDMQLALKIKDIDGIYLYPYYSQWVDLEKGRIESAKLNLTTDIHGLNNAVNAECRLELTDIVRKPRPAGEPKEKAERLADAILGVFTDSDEKNVALDFTIKTKMDKPDFSFGNIKAAVEEKLLAKAAGESFKPQDVLMLPTKLIEGTVKGATDISKAVIDGTFAVGNELKNAVQDSFRREKEE